MLDSCLDRLDIFEFLNHVEDGLKDHYDIKMLTYLMLVRLAHLCPSAVLQSKSEFTQLTRIHPIERLGAKKIAKWEGVVI